MRIEALDFFERLAGVLQNPRVDGNGSAKDAAIDPLSPHPDLEALPLLARSVRLKHARIHANSGLGRSPVQGRLILVVALVLALVVAFVVVFCRRGDVIDVDVLVLRAPILVRVVESAYRTFLDRTPRAAVAVLTRGFALVLGRRVRAEITAARGGCPTGVGPGGEAARSRGPEASGTGTTRTGWRATGTGTGEAARTWRAAGAPFLARPCFADRQRPALERLLIESANGFFGDGAICVIHERKSPRPACFAIDWQHDLGRGSHAREVFP